MNRKLLYTLLSAPAAVLLLSLSGCTDEKIVYRDRELWEQPPAASAGYLGYSKADDKLTVCGNCHMGQQAAWVETGHADAWAGLQESGHAQAFCEGCHTVSELGNLPEAQGGWSTTKDTRYYDVQCESCHGPGLAHVSNPSNATIPSVLAPLAAGMDMKTGCIECHNGTHHPYGEEWSSSTHGTVPNSAYAGGRDGCKECHAGEDAISIKFGLDREFVEKDQYGSSSTMNLPITCAVCHDPHDAHYEGQLRKSLSEADLSKNLCMKCHYKRGIPDPTTFRGPHTPEGPLLLGDAGWWSDTMKVLVGAERLESTHGSASANPKLCAGCHMNRFEYTDEAGVAISGTGHTFEAIPCVTATGAPTVGGDCAPTERSYKSCTTAGCHGSEGAARSAVTTAQLRIASLVAELDLTLQQVKPNWKSCRNNSSCGLASNGLPTWSTSDNVYTTAEGAGFNHGMGARTSAVIHNPMLVETLLITSIMQVKKDYGLTGASLVDLTPQLKQH